MMHKISGKMQKFSASSVNVTTTYRFHPYRFPRTTLVYSKRWTLTVKEFRSYLVSPNATNILIVSHHSNAYVAIVEILQVQSKHIDSMDGAVKDDGVDIEMIS